MKRNKTQIHKRDLYNRVFYNNIGMFFVLLFAVAFAICLLVCWREYDAEMNRRQETVDREAYLLKERISLVIDKMNFVSQNYDLLEPLNHPIETVKDRYAFDNTAKDFFSMVEQSDFEVTIYTENETVFENAYIMHSERLADYDEVSERLSGLSDNILYTGYQSDGEYFLFYHKLPLIDDALIRVRLFAKPNESILLENGDASGAERSGVEKRQVFYDTYAFMECDNSELYGTILAVIILAVVLLIFVYICMWQLVKIRTKNLVANIEDFVTRLDANEIKKDERHFAASEEDTIEIKKIKEVISELIDEIKRNEDERHKNEMLNQRLKNELIRSQLNPHTLYNSLSAIKVYAFERKDDYTVELVDSMVKYYHMILHKNKTISTVDDELELISSYLKICEMAYSEQYNFIKSVGIGCGAVPILHQFLIPFVENSIVHAFTGESKNCTIRFSADLCGDSVRIVIEDNGYGIPADKLESLNNMENYELGYGVKNACMRAKLTYTSGFDIRFESELNRFTRVTIKINNYKDIVDFE